MDAAAAVWIRFLFPVVIAILVIWRSVSLVKALIGVVIVLGMGCVYVLMALITPHLVQKLSDDVFMSWPEIRCRQPRTCKGCLFALQKHADRIRRSSEGLHMLEKLPLRILLKRIARLSRIYVSEYSTKFDRPDINNNLSSFSRALIYLLRVPVLIDSFQA